MLESFWTWFSNIEWTSWDALAAIGQVVGAGATVWAVMVSLKQTKYSQQQTEASLKQTQLAIEQLEDARKRELEASKLKLKIRIHLAEKKIHITLSNTKQTPIPIHSFDLNYHHINKDGVISDKGLRVFDKGLESAFPKTILPSDIYKISIPIDTLVEDIQIPETVVFRGSFIVESGEVYRVSILVDIEETTGFVDIYACPFLTKTIDEIRTDENYIQYKDDYNYYKVPLKQKDIN